MSKKVTVAEVPRCDLCRATDPSDQVKARYDAPLNALGKSLFGASWANMCAGCFAQYGVDTSVTSEFVQATR